MERFFLSGPVGRLEAILDHPDGPATAAALLCHPLPPGGGTMHTHAVFRAMRALRECGVAVLRFNFRGVGGSQGHWDEGPGELDDGLAAFEQLRSRFPEVPLIAGGFSFGSWVGMVAGVRRGAHALLGLGAPYLGYDYSEVAPSTLAKALVHADRDDFTPLATLQNEVARMQQPVRLWVVQGATHLFTERLDAYQAAVHEATSWLLPLANETFGG
jgi:alpha/beta superfamily hydrolase